MIFCLPYLLTASRSLSSSLSLSSDTTHVTVSSLSLFADAKRLSAVSHLYPSRGLPQASSSLLKPQASSSTFKFKINLKNMSASRVSSTSSSDPAVRDPSSFKTQVPQLQDPRTQVFQFANPQEHSRRIACPRRQDRLQVRPMSCLIFVNSSREASISELPFRPS